MALKKGTVPLRIPKKTFLVLRCSQESTEKDVAKDGAPQTADVNVYKFHVYLW
jgi:hypothetical protein